MRRLNRREYIETVHDLLPGVTVDSNLFDSMPEDTLAPFDNDALTQSASQRLIESTNRLAGDLAVKATSTPEARARLGVHPGSVTLSALRNIGMMGPFGEVTAALPDTLA